MHHKRVDKAGPGDNVGMNIKGLDKVRLRRGAGLIEGGFRGSLQQCTDCLAKSPAPEGLDILTWRTRHAEFLNGARFVMGPARDVLLRLAKTQGVAAGDYPHRDAGMGVDGGDHAFEGHMWLTFLVGCPHPNPLPLPFRATCPAPAMS